MTFRPPAPGLEPFVRAVVRQLAGSTVPDPSGAAGDPDARTEAAVRRLVGAAVEGGSTAALGAELAGDVPLLASFFQNVDLLYAHGYADADAVSALIMAALEALETPDGG
jgi:hypothetical protein